MHMHEIWPIGRRGNKVEFADGPPAELIAALEALPPNAIRARALLTVLALNPGEIHGPAELLTGIRSIDPHAKPSQALSLHATLRDVKSRLQDADISVPLEQLPLPLQPLNGNNHFQRMGWVWRINQE